MKALKVFEAYNFQRGQDPKRSLSLGKYKSLLYRALTDPDNEVNGEAFRDWMETNPTLKETIEYNPNEPIDQYLTFDLDWYCEDKQIDRDELVEDFEARKLLGRKKSGELIVKVGIIKNIPQPNKVLFYQGGNIDGFITKKSWIGINESMNFERGLDPKLSMDIGVTQTIFNKWGEFLKELGIRSLSIEKSLNGKWHLVIIPFGVASPKIIYSKIQRYFGDYIGPTYRRKNSDPEISVMIKPEFVPNFIRAYNMKYPGFPLEDK